MFLPLDENLKSHTLKDLEILKDFFKFLLLAALFSLYNPLKISLYTCM
jgi:hypothetical protein